MERSVAIKKLIKRFGKHFAYQINKDALPPHEREALRPEYDRAREVQVKLREALDARYKLLLSDPEYLALRDQANKARRYVDELGWKIRQKKITVGTSNNLCFHVGAEGDSWEEVIAACDKK